MLVRISILFIALLTAPTLFAQTALWSRVSPEQYPPTLPQAQLTHAEIAAIHQMLNSSAQRSSWGCDDDHDPALVNRPFLFSNVSLATGHRTILIEGGPICGFAGNGGGGPMWIVEFHDSRLSLLASPDQDFNGWLFSIQPNPHNKYSDIVLGWHMGAQNTELTYFRFNGHSYDSISTATDKGTIKDDPPSSTP